MFPNAIMNQGAGSPAGDAVTPPGGELLHVFVSNMQKQTEVKCFFRPLTEKKQSVPFNYMLVRTNCHILFTTLPPRGPSSLR